MAFNHPLNVSFITKKMVYLKNIGKKFDKKWILKNLDLSIAPQESIVILGMSGSGKSLLLKILAGLMLPDAGNFVCPLRSLGMCFQNNALFDSMTVEENILFPFRNAKNIPVSLQLEKAHDLLQKTDLFKSRMKYPYQISGGMQKRVAVARAMIMQPKMLLFDEPTAGLDPVTSKNIVQLILKTRTLFTTSMVTVTNDVEVACTLGSHILLLHAGKLISAGSPENFKISIEPHIQQFRLGQLQGPLTTCLV